MLYVAGGIDRTATTPKRNYFAKKGEDEMEFVISKYIYVPILVWFFIQAFKVVWDLVETKKFNFKRILGARTECQVHILQLQCALQS